MSGARFQRVVQSEDYRLESLPQGPQHHSNEKDDNPGEIGPSPSRWKSMKLAFEPTATYVAAPTDLSPEKAQQKRVKFLDRRSSSRLSFLVNPVSNVRIPTFASPWQHEKDDTSPKTVRHFDRSKQWRRVLTNGLLRWLITLVIALCQWSTIYGFSQPATLSKSQKYAFNALITLLSVAIGLAIITALKSYAKLLSWRFLASQYRNLQDFELVMNCESQLKVLKLLWAGRTPGRFWLNKTQLLCIVSLSLVLGLQVTIGLVGLTYSIEASDAPELRWGNVSLVDLSNIYQNSRSNRSDLADQRAAANYYGLVGQNYWMQPDVPMGECDGGFETLCTTDNQSYFYNFVDQSTNMENPISKSSKRWIQTDAACVKLEIHNDGGYLHNNITYSYVNYTDEHGALRDVYVEDITSLTTTYMSDISNSSCGERCTNILILDTSGFIDDNSPDDPLPVPQLWACNSSVSEIHNTETCTNSKDCTLTDELAKVLSGAISLTGTWTIDSTAQYKTYPPGSPYSWDGLNIGAFENATTRANGISWFTTGAIAAMDAAGPRITVPGYTPQPGVTLKVEWQFAIPCLAVIPAVQLLVLCIVCIFANGALIKDSSYLSTAHLLRPVVEKLEEHGCALTGDEIARELGNYRIVYGVRAPTGTKSPTEYTSIDDPSVNWHVGIIAESEGHGASATEGWRPAATFPGGSYDGAGYTRDGRESRKTCKMSMDIQEQSDSELKDGDEKAQLLHHEKNT